MKDIVFATNNEHKLSELRQLMAGKYNVLSLADIGCHDDIPETAPTIEGNAMIKARLYDSIQQTRLLCHTKNEILPSEYIDQITLTC